MLYERSRRIEERLDNVLHMIETGEYSTPSMAAALGVSIPTISRCVTALRERGNDIHAEKRGNCWHYVLIRKTKGVATLTSAGW